jgi:hypothetical protein
VQYYKSENETKFILWRKKHTTNYVPPESSDEDCFDSDDSVGDKSYVPENYTGG